MALGVTELDSGEGPLPGAPGRQRPQAAADLDPGLRPALLALVEPDMRGEPMSPLRWTDQVDPQAGRRAALLRCPLAVHHDDLADATGGSYRPGDPIVAALVAMKQAVDGFHVGDDPWLEYLRSTGRHIATASGPSR